MFFVCMSLFFNWSVCLNVHYSLFTNLFEPHLNGIRISIPISLRPTHVTALIYPRDRFGILVGGNKIGYIGAVKNYVKCKKIYGTTLCLNIQSVCVISVSPGVPLLTDTMPNIVHVPTVSHGYVECGKGGGGGGITRSKNILVNKYAGFLRPWINWHISGLSVCPKVFVVAAGNDDDD